jgi:hypothetical protein
MIKENSKMKYHVDLYRFFLHLHVKSFWIGLDWIGLDWIGLDWIGLDWIGLIHFALTREMFEPVHTHH